MKKSEMTAEYLFERYEKITKSLTTLQEELWKMVDNLNRQYLANVDDKKNSFFEDGMYHKKLETVLIKIKHLRALELTLFSLFRREDYDITKDPDKALDEMVLSTAEMYTVIR